MTNLLSPVRIGAQTPVYDTGPVGVTSAHQEVVELYQSAGRDLDIWQRYTLKQGLQERADGKWSALEVALLVSRQNGKGDILTARQMGGLFLFGSKLSLYSAHEFKTAAEMFVRLRDMVMNTDDLRKRVKKVIEAHGEEGIELLNGNRIRFIARSRGSGRGFSGDDIYLDEAMILSSKMVGAMMPVMSARPNPQIWYASSAPHIDSDMLRKIQRRGRAGTSARLRYMEWCARNANASLDLTDPGGLDALYEANPAMGIRLTTEFTQSEREAMDDVEYARERLGLTEDVDGAGVIDMSVWEELEDKASRRDGPIVIAADITPERSWGAISFCGRRADGLWHVEISQHRRGTGWMATELVRLAKRADVTAVVIDDKSQAATLVPDFKEAVEEDPELSRDDKDALLDKLVITTAQDMATACSFFYTYTLLDGETNPVLRHIGQPTLTVAVAGATKRSIGTAGAWAWDRKSPAVDITPLVSVTLALWGRIVHGKKKEIDLEPYVMVL